MTGFRRPGVPGSGPSAKMDFVTVENGPVRHLKPAATYQESVGANWGNCLSKTPKPIVLSDQVSYGNVQRPN